MANRAFANILARSQRADVSSNVSIPLRDLLDCFPPPQIGTIVRGFDVEEEFGIPHDTLLTFRQRPTSEATLQFCRRYSDNVSVTLPIEGNPLRFRLLPYDPVSGDKSPGHVYRSAADLVQAFPVYAQCNVDYLRRARSSSLNSTTGGAVDISGEDIKLSRGDELKLGRVVYRRSGSVVQKCVECRRLQDGRLLTLPLDSAAYFTSLPNNNDYSLADLVRLRPACRRRVQPSRLDPLLPPQQIPGLPDNLSAGDLFVEIPESFFEAIPVSGYDDLQLGLPHNMEMMIKPDESCFDRGELLNTFAANSRSLFPVLVRMTDWTEETTILVNHYVRPGVDLVMHGWTRQSKVLARCGDIHYALPLTYQGRFKVKKKVYLGARKLSAARPQCKLRVVKADKNEDSPVFLGDVVVVKKDTDNSLAEHVRYLRLERLSKDGSKRVEVRVPLGNAAIFEEILEKCPPNIDSVTVKELSDTLQHQDIEVELIRASPDVNSPGSDIPLNKSILLSDLVMEQAVYVSLENPDAPAFHIPLRTLMYVKLLQQLDRRCSPLLTKQSPKLSTLDRCVEVLPADVYSSLRPAHRSFESQDNLETNEKEDSNSWKSETQTNWTTETTSAMIRSPPSGAESNNIPKQDSQFNKGFSQVSSTKSIAAPQPTSPAFSKPVRPPPVQAKPQKHQASTSIAANFQRQTSANEQQVSKLAVGQLKTQYESVGKTSNNSAQQGFSRNPTDAQMVYTNDDFTVQHNVQNVDSPRMHYDSWEQGPEQQWDDTVEESTRNTGDENNMWTDTMIVEHENGNIMLEDQQSTIDEPAWDQFDVEHVEQNAEYKSNSPLLQQNAAEDHVEVMSLEEQIAQRQLMQREQERLEERMQQQLLAQQQQHEQERLRLRERLQEQQRQELAVQEQLHSEREKQLAVQRLQQEQLEQLLHEKKLLYEKEQQLLVEQQKLQKEREQQEEQEQLLQRQMELEQELLRQRQLHEQQLEEEKLKQRVLEEQQQEQARLKQRQIELERQEQIQRLIQEQEREQEELRQKQIEREKELARLRQMQQERQLETGMLALQQLRLHEQEQEHVKQLQAYKEEQEALRRRVVQERQREKELELKRKQQQQESMLQQTKTQVLQLQPAPQQRHFVQQKQAESESAEGSQNEIGLHVSSDGPKGVRSNYQPQEHVRITNTVPSTSGLREQRYEDSEFEQQPRFDSQRSQPAQTLLPQASPRRPQAENSASFGHKVAKIQPSAEYSSKDGVRSPSLVATSQHSSLQSGRWPDSQTPAAPPGFMLIPIHPDAPVLPPVVNGLYERESGSNDTLTTDSRSKQVKFDRAANMESDDDASEIFDIGAKPIKSKLKIPDDGNLYKLSVKKFLEILSFLKLDDDVLARCRKQKLDGKEFSKMSESEMIEMGLVHPILAHFRCLTGKKNNFTL